MRTASRNRSNFVANRTKNRPLVDLNDKAMTAEKKMFEGLNWLFDDAGITSEDYRKMMMDPQVKAAVKIKTLARMSSGWEIQAASEEPPDVQVRDFVSDQLEVMTGTVDGFLRDAMKSMALKLTVHEICYRHIAEGEWNGRVGLRQLKWKKPETFKIVTDDYGNLTKLEQNRGFNDIKSLDKDYFVIWAWEHEGDYQGKSDLEAAHQWWKTKLFISKFWNIFLEKFASPTAIGKFQRGTDNTTKRTVLDYLTNLQKQGAAVVPDSWTVEFLEAKRNGSDFEKALQYCDRMIARALLIPSLLLDEGQSGSYSLGKSHATTFRWVLESLGSQIEEDIMGDQLIKRLVDHNFPSIDTYPKFKFKEFSDTTFKDDVESMCKLVDAGLVDVNEPIARQKLDLPEREHKNNQIPDDGSNAGAGESPESGEEKPAGKAAAPAPGKLGFAEGPHNAKPGPDPSPVPFATFAETSLNHAGKCEFARYEQTLDSIEAQARAGMARGVRSMHQAMMKKLKGGKLLQGMKTADVDKITLPMPMEFRRALETGFGHVIHHGVADAMGEMNRGLASAGGQALPDLGATSGNNFTAAEIAADFSLAEVLESWDKRVPIQRALLTHYNAEAYTITGVLHNDLLVDSKAVIRRALLHNTTYPQIEQALNELFEPYYMQEVDPIVGTSHRLQTIVRTNMSSAYNTGRENLFNHPEVGTFIRAYEYSSVMDDRTSDVCAAWHGKVLKKDNPIWGTMTPPNHHQCRSVKIPIVQGEAFTETKAPGERPQRGFKM